MAEKNPDVEKPSVSDGFSARKRSCVQCARRSFDTSKQKKRPGPGPSKKGKPARSVGCPGGCLIGKVGAWGEHVWGCPLFLNREVLVVVVVLLLLLLSPLLPALLTTILSSLFFTSVSVFPALLAAV